LLKELPELLHETLHEPDIVSSSQQVIHMTKGCRAAVENAFSSSLTNRMVLYLGSRRLAPAYDEPANLSAFKNRINKKHFSTSNAT